MAKRVLSAAESFALRQSLQVVTLDALMASRRWSPGDLIFQGGTSLHLAHGSPRFSEDLDFLVGSSLNLDAIAESTRKGLAGTAWIPKDADLTVTKAKEGKNLHSFVVSIGGEQVLGAVRVKIELWRTDPTTMAGIKTVVSPVRLASGPGAGMQAFVPTAQTSEIYADKVFALVARPYLKPRDIFDLHWLTQNEEHVCSVDDLRVRLATYPNETPAGWLAKAGARRAELMESAALVQKDLQRWLPSSWPLTSAAVAQMLEAAVQALDLGVALMEDIESGGNGHVNGHADTSTAPAP